MKLSVGIAASLIVTAASYYLLERPFLRLKDRFKFTSPARSELNAATEHALTFDSARNPIPSHDCPVGTI